MARKIENPPEAGEIRFMVLLHDDSCPGAYGHPERCNCEPEMREVGETEFRAIVERDAVRARAADAARSRRAEQANVTPHADTVTRQQRRAAERAARKASRKGRGQ